MVYEFGLLWAARGGDNAPATASGPKAQQQAAANGSAAQGGAGGTAKSSGGGSDKAGGGGDEDDDGAGPCCEAEPVSENGDGEPYDVYDMSHDVGLFLAWGYATVTGVLSSYNTVFSKLCGASRARFKGL